MLEDVHLAPEWKIHPGLPGRDYHAPEIWELEKARIFSRSWYCVSREEQLAGAGDYLTHDVADESVIVIRGKDDELRAFANVCRHRGSRLLNESSGRVRAITCPYHAWTYGVEGDLRATPNVLEEDGLPREEYGLYPIALETWQGFVFVSLAQAPRPLLDALAAEPDGPLDYDRYRLGELRLAHRIVYEVEANWKIIIDNYNECLHCPSVHPELVKIVPLYRKGMVMDPAKEDVGATLDEGLDAFTLSGTTSLPRLPGLSEIHGRTYYGYSIFPNLLVNLTPTGVMVYSLHPTSPSHTRWSPNTSTARKRSRARSSIRATWWSSSTSSVARTGASARTRSGASPHATSSEASIRRRTRCSTCSPSAIWRSVTASSSSERPSSGPRTEAPQ